MITLRTMSQQVMQWATLVATAGVVGALSSAIVTLLNARSERSAREKMAREDREARDSSAREDRAARRRESHVAIAAKLAELYTANVKDSARTTKSAMFLDDPMRLLALYFTELEHLAEHGAVSPEFKAKGMAR